VSAVQVEQVNPRNEPLLHAVWAVGHAASLERPVDLWIAWEDARRRWPLPAVERDIRILAAFDENRVVGGARLDLPESDNTHLVFADVWVAPQDRRRGYGTALADEVERIARASGRTTVLTDAHGPLDGETDGSRFARARGYQVAGIEETKVVDLAATEHTWPGLARHAAEAMDGYQLVSWTDPTPAEHLASLCALFSRFSTEAPMEEMDIRPMTYTPERMRRDEERTARGEIEHLLVAAVAPDGSLAGYSDVRVPRVAPRVASIASTLVLPEHRGHRLGLGLKVRLHQETRRRFPGCELIGTGNAAVNRWMNAVNEQLGYVIVDYALELQKVL
jgi:GNAT superfamily N-acetyltransferase